MNLPTYQSTPTKPYLLNSRRPSNRYTPCFNLSPLVLARNSRLNDLKKGLPGPSNRVVGKTPDDSFVQRGRPASKYSHQIRRELSRLLTMEIDTLVVMLYQNPNYKSGKKKKLTVRIPDLSKAMEELVEELAIRDERLLEHVVLRRMWAPAMCRLLEIRSMYQ